MKKYNFLLSVILVPSMVLQAGNTCPSGGSGSSPTLPASVTGVQTYNYMTPTLYDFKVNTVSSAGALTPGTTYPAWCTYHNGIVPGGGTNPDGTVTLPVNEDPQNSTGVATYTPVYSYSITAGEAGPNFGEPGLTYDATLNGDTGGFTGTTLTLTEEWSAVNWILNNPNGVSGETPTTTDTQNAIWQLLHPDDQHGYVVFAAFSSTASLTGSSWLLYKDALANGLNFTPAAGQVAGVLMVPTTPADGSGAYQGFLIPVPITCTATGSATLTKTSNVGSGGANPFQTVTYTYTIKNTGSTTLQNLVIVDDNGTPNYSADDVTISLPAGTTLAPGASYKVTSTVYLPISLFYQSGNEAAFDTLIPTEIAPSTGHNYGQLLLTYLIDSDVSDNTYGTNASAGWAGNGGHTFAQELGGWAEFAFYSSKGNLLVDFDTPYLQNVGGSTPSGYGVAPLTTSIYGSLKYVNSTTSTLADLLNYYPQFVDNTVNSPVAGTPSWQPIAGYKIVIDNGLFGLTGGVGSAVVKKNYLAATETAFSGKCGSTRPATYTPTICSSTVTNTAYLCAQVCGCSTIIHAKACLSVKLCGATRPTCGSASSHKCQNQVCSCTCPHCQAGDHANCSHVGCTDPICHAKNCNHNTIQCVIASVHKTICW